MKNKLTPPSPVDRNIYAMSKEERIEIGIVDLPGTLAEALENLKNDHVITQALGSHLLEHFLEAKEIEWDQFRSAVHPWERERYLESQ